ncbi:MAG: hypothetical protein J2P35_06935 [Actinobacteria bacterium]|nr:hypothetical protein [Actinomycetota bacterium]MBO0786993.1 hypothetical protein [Actinomycetota bacterium]
MPRSLPSLLRGPVRRLPLPGLARRPPLRRLLRRRILVPAVLAALGLVLLLIAVGLYPSQSEQPAPAYPLLRVIADFPVQVVEYSTAQLTPATAEIKVTLALPAGTQAPPLGAAKAQVAMAPPFGVRFTTCPPPGCQHAARGPGEAWIRSLDFRPGPESGRASTEFLVRARRFGVSVNGVTAAAALPDVTYQGPGTPRLVSSFVIPSGSSYDWSSVPEAAASRAGVVFQDDITAGHAPARDAVGINHAGQAAQNDRTFVAGILLGLAGGALLGAVQEALHAAGRSPPETGRGAASD